MVWSRLHVDLKAYLTERAGNQMPLLTFYHRQLAEVAAGGSISPGRQAANCTVRIADYFERLPLNLESGTEARNLRKLAELPYQQHHAGRQTGLALLDCSFLRAKVATLGPQAMMDDYDRAAAGPGFGLCRSSRCCGRRYAPVAAGMTRDPTQFAGQLQGRLRPCPPAGAEDLVREVAAGTDSPWLRPVGTGLVRAGGVLMQTYPADLNGTRRLVPTPNSAKVLALDSEDRVKLWDLQPGITPASPPDLRGTGKALVATPTAWYAASGAADSRDKT